MQMAKYRKKQVIEAVLYDGELIGNPGPNGKVIPGTCPAWFPAVLRETHPDNIWAGPGEIFYAGDELRFGTPDGGVTIKPGDWIVLGLDGEMHIHGPGAFAMNYEPVNSNG